MKSAIAKVWMDKSDTPVKVDSIFLSEVLPFRVANVYHVAFDDHCRGETVCASGGQRFAGREAGVAVDESGLRLPAAQRLRSSGA